MYVTVVALFLAVPVTGCLSEGQDLRTENDEPGSTETASGEDARPAPNESQAQAPGEGSTGHEYGERSFQTSGTTDAWVCRVVDGEGACYGVSAIDEVTESGFEDPALQPAKRVAFSLTWDEPGVELNATVTIEGEDETRQESFEGSSPVEGVVEMEDAGWKIEVSAWQWLGDPSTAAVGGGVPVTFDLSGTAWVLES